MSFVTLHGRDGRLVHIRPEQVSVVDTDEDGETTVTVDSTYCWVRESPEEVLALVESWESNDVAAAMKTVGKAAALMDGLHRELELYKAEQFVRNALAAQRKRR